MGNLIGPAEDAGPYHYWWPRASVCARTYSVERALVLPVHISQHVVDTPQEGHNIRDRLAPNNVRNHLQMSE
jgi:hypothetical protein